MLKKITAILLVGIMSATMCFAYDYDPVVRKPRPISLQVNGEKVEFAVEIKSVDDTAYGETEKLATALKIDQSELSIQEIDGVKMSPIRTSVDKKGYSTYWSEWQKTIIVIDTDSFINDIKDSTKTYCELFKKSIKIPENGEYVFNSKLNYKIDGGENGFSLFAGADFKGNIKVEKDKIAGEFTIDADGLYKIFSMVANSFIKKPNAPLTFKFYIDDSGIYYKSAFVNNMLFDDYNVSDTFKTNNLDKWIKVGYDEIGIADFKTVSSIRNYDADVALNQYINSLLFDDIDSKKMYATTYSYNDIKNRVEMIKKWLNSNYLTSKDDKFTFKFTEKDLKWSFEDWKKQIQDEKYTKDEDKQANIALLERFIDSIKGSYTIETTFKNNILDKSTENLKFEATIPFYFNQQICNLSASIIGGTDVINLGKTVITDKVPTDFITNEMIQQAEKYKLENYKTPNQGL